MNRPSTHILVSKYHSPLKESKLLGKINAEANKVQDKPGVSFKIRKHVKYSKNDEDYQRGTGARVKGLTVATVGTV